MAKKNWERVNPKLWRSKVDPHYTVEIGEAEGYDEGDPESVGYYVYPAFNGVGIPNSPDAYYSGNKRSDLADAKRMGERITALFSGSDLQGFSWRVVGDIWEPLPVARKALQGPRLAKPGPHKRLCGTASVRGLRR